MPWYQEYLIDNRMNPVALFLRLMTDFSKHLAV